jgi:hypothetical protein
MNYAYQRNVVETLGSESIQGADVRNSGVPYQLQAMEKNMAFLMDTITALQSKLNPIMRPQPENVTKDSSSRALGDSELASFLARANLTLEEQVRRLTYLVNGADL